MVLMMFKELKANDRSIACRKLVYGHGVCDVSYRIQIKTDGRLVTCPYYIKWSSMLQRCYSSKYHEKKPTYMDCSVCDEWLSFRNFKRWMETQDWEGKQLDKDIALKGSTVYSPDTCIFVDGNVNRLLNSCGARRGAYPQGVSFYGSRKKKRFRVNISMNGKSYFIGYYDNADKASIAYRIAKNTEITRVASLPTNKAIKKLILQHIEI